MYIKFKFFKNSIEGTRIKMMGCNTQGEKFNFPYPLLALTNKRKQFFPVNQTAFDGGSIGSKNPVTNKTPNLNAPADSGENPEKTVDDGRTKKSKKEGRCKYHEIFKRRRCPIDKGG